MWVATRPGGARETLSASSASRRRRSGCAPIPPVLGRHAPAGGHRHRHAARAGPDHRRRADHRPRRHHSGQILYEMQRLRREREMALIWITHDLSVVAALADRVAVMYAGRIVEQGGVDEVLDTPEHPYTQGLIGSIPRPRRHGRRARPDSGDDAVANRYRARLPVPGALLAGNRSLLRRPPAAYVRTRACGLLPPSGRQPMTSALMRLHSVSRHFVRRLDLVARVARRLGANLREEVVRAVAASTCRSNPARWWDSSANPAAASRRWGASWPEFTSRRSARSRFVVAVSRR